MKILFIVPYPTEGPSNRYRVEQYLPFLKEKGIEYSLRPFISRDFFRILYQKGRLTLKTCYFLYSALNRLTDLVRAVKSDLVFVHIESFPFGPAAWEWLFSRIGRPIIYDFEDAVYLKDFRQESKPMSFLRFPEKFYQILKLSSQVVVCNRYMRDFVSPFNNNITVIPTSIDTQKFRIKDYSLRRYKITIGWIGSHSTLYCLKSIEPVFRELAKNHVFKLKVIGAGTDYKIPGVEVVSEDWSLEKEVENFQSLDIGVYPLPGDERAMAKTPFKTVQYLSVGLAVVASAIGGNLEIIQDGKNGFLAKNNEDWVKKLSLLLKDSALRQRLGIAGRKTVEARYSLAVNADKFVEVLEKACQQK